jgi:ribosomal protein L37AE/L43A
MSEDGEGGCKDCNFEPSKFCPIEKTSISSSDCEDKRQPYCQTCNSVTVSLPTQGELTSDLVWVCDDCQKVVDFTHQKVSEMFSNSG